MSEFGEPSELSEKHSAQQAALFSQLPTSVQQQVDALLYTVHFIDAVILIRKTLGIDLKEGVTLFQWRHKVLSTLNPAQFNYESDEENTVF